MKQWKVSLRYSERSNPNVMHNEQTVITAETYYDAKKIMDIQYGHQSGRNILEFNITEIR